MTPHCFKKLREELDYLLKIDRPEVTRTVTWAASNGDRSENADYIYGKKRMREIDRRVRFLSSRLDNAEVINPADIRSERVLFGATVELADEEGENKKISIVGVDEIDTLKGHISYQSPIGSQLLGKTIGDVVVIRTPRGNLEYEILSIAYKDIHEN